MPKSKQSFLFELQGKNKSVIPAGFQDRLKENVLFFWTFIAKSDKKAFLFRRTSTHLKESNPRPGEEPNSSEWHVI